MPKYLIEREVPGAGKLSPSELQSIAHRSCDVLTEMGPQVQWIHTYVTGDKLTCVYYALNEDLVREHARRGGFPANSVQEITSIMDPSTAEGHRQAS